MSQLDTESPRALRGGSGLAAHKLQRAFAVIEANLGTTLHVRQLAESVGLSPFHFARMFKKSTGQSPHLYVTRRRMELAKRLLADDSLPLAEVAARSGYHTQAHFTDAFRRQVGTTPGRYRRSCLDSRGAPPTLAHARVEERMPA